MANVQTAIAFVLALEDDHQHPGCITQLRGDSGGRTRLGIASRFHPELAAQGFFEGDPIPGSSNPLRWAPTTIDLAAAADLAADLSRREYANPLLINQIADQDLANRMLGFGVNEGVHQAAVLLQRCLPGIVADGILGPLTIARINALDAADILAAQFNFAGMQSRAQRHVHLSSGGAEG